MIAIVRDGRVLSTDRHNATIGASEKSGTTAILTPARQPPRRLLEISRPRSGPGAMPAPNPSAMPSSSWSTAVTLGHPIRPGPTDQPRERLGIYDGQRHRRVA